MSNTITEVIGKFLTLKVKVKNQKLTNIGIFITEYTVACQGSGVSGKPALGATQLWTVSHAGLEFTKNLENLDGQTRLTQ